MRRYEIMSNSGGLEFGAAVPFSWSGEPDIKGAFFPFEGSRLALGGYATRYDTPHPYKGGIDVFRPGCFAKSLLTNANVRFLEEHSEAKCLAATGAGLRLWSDAVGLSFKVELPDTPAGRAAFSGVKSGRRAGMSVGYRVLQSERRTIAGEDVRLISDASLIDISLVREGAVKQAYAVSLPSDEDIERPYFSTKTSANASAAFARLRESHERLKQFVRER